MRGNNPGQSPQVTKPPAAYVEALKAAVAASQSPEGWANIASIRVHLHNNGHRLESSGFETLESALKASQLFDMCDAGGTNKTFKLASKNTVA